MSSLVSRSSKKSLQLSNELQSQERGVSCLTVCMHYYHLLLLLVVVVALYGYTLIQVKTVSAQNHVLSSLSSLSKLYQSSSMRGPVNVSSINSVDSYVMKNLHFNYSVSSDKIKQTPNESVSLSLLPMQPVSNVSTAEEHAENKPQPSTPSDTSGPSKPPRNKADDFEGKVVKVFNDHTVYLVKDGKRHEFSTGDEFLSSGREWNQIQIVGLQVAALLPIAEPVSKMGKRSELQS